MKNIIQYIVILLKGGTCLKKRAFSNNNNWKPCMVLFLATVIFFCTGCGQDEPENETERIPESISVEGATLQTGYEIDDDYMIVSKQTTFKANEDFYFSFYNNEPFGVEEVLIELIYSGSGEVKADNKYEVDPDGDTVYDMIWFGQPGIYKVSAQVGEEVRAMQEVIIEAENN